MNIETKTTQEFRVAVIVDGVTLCTCDDPGKASVVMRALQVAEVEEGSWTVMAILADLKTATWGAE
jgi:hypothetical protein